MAAMVGELPRTIVAPDMDVEQEIRMKAGQFIGRVISGGSVSVELAPLERPIENLKDGIDRAYYEGDETALRMVESNVGTDVVERTIKKGHVMKKVALSTTAEGKLTQHGQIMETVQANSLIFASEHPIMRMRTEAETRNTFRIQQYYKDDVFKTHSLLVVSRAEKLPGFFVETMSCSLQLIGEAEAGLALESAFVAGIATEGEQPHDEATTVKLGEVLGADYAGLTPAEIIDRPILIRNDLIPNGVIDVVKMWDTISGTFFGEDRPAEDYLEYLKKCHERETLFKPKIAQITKELISAAPTIHNPIEAARVLNDLSGLHMVELAIRDSSIDSRVFGEEASVYIDAGRLAYQRGDIVLMERHQRKAEQTEQSSSCPSSMSNSNPDFESSSSSTDDDEDCEFKSKECPLCLAKNVWTKVQKLRTSGRKRISGSCGCVKIA